MAEGGENQDEGTLRDRFTRHRKPQFIEGKTRRISGISTEVCTPDGTRTQQYDGMIRKRRGENQTREVGQEEWVRTWRYLKSDIRYRNPPPT